MQSIGVAIDDVVDEVNDARQGAEHDKPRQRREYRADVEEPHAEEQAGEDDEILAPLSGTQGEEKAQGKRTPGQQPGAKGPKRRLRLNLPVEELHHRLGEQERTCPICHQIDPEIGVTEESEEIELVFCAKRVRHIRHCYKRGCHCVPGPTIRTAPKPAKLIAKGLFAASFWLEVLLKKFEFKQPLQRTVEELKTLGLKVSPGTLDGGLQKIQPMLQPLVGQFVLRARQGCHWHMDETRWPTWVGRITASSPSAA